MQVPQALREARQWVCRKGKQPCNAEGISGGWNETSFWMAYEEALDAFAIKGFDGIGFIIARDESRGINQIIGGDIDCCRDPQTSELSGEAYAVLQQLNCPTEVSPSGTGIRFFCFGKLPDIDSIKSNLFDDLPEDMKTHIIEAKPTVQNLLDKGENPWNSIEIYEHGPRHLTVTGAWLQEYPKELENCQPSLLQVLGPLIEAKKLFSNSNDKSQSSLPFLNIYDVIDTRGFMQSGAELVGSHPVFGSTTGTNLKVNIVSNVWAYFHAGSECGGDPWLWLACECGAIAWNQSKKGALTDPDAIQKTKQHALDRGLLSEDVLFPERKEIHKAVEAAMILKEQALEDVGVPFESKNIELLAFVKKHDPANFQRIIAAWKRKVNTTELLKLLGEKGATKVPQQEKKPGPAEIVLNAVLDKGYELWHTGDGVCFITIDGQHVPICGEEFGGMIRREYYDQNDQALSKVAEDAAKRTLCSFAIDGKEHDLFVRIAQHENCVYLDMANDNNETIEISKDGWKVIDSAPVRFRRPNGMKPLPYPEKGGTLEDIRPVVNVCDDQWILMKAWLIGTLNPKGAYTVLVLNGGPGKLKSKTTERLKKVMDPSYLPLESMKQGDPDSFMLAAYDNHALGLDNVSRLSDDQSDMICKVSTGVGIRTRKFFTNLDSILLELRKCIILNGVSEFVARGDLIDRSIHLELPAITHKPGAEKDHEFDEKHPKILGALLDAAVRGLTNTDVKPKINTRMADFSKWVVACLPEEEREQFEQEYQNNKGAALKFMAEGNSLLDAIVSFMEKQALVTGSTCWCGTASELLKLLTIEVGIGSATVLRKDWPNTATWLSSRLNMYDMQLKQRGVYVERGHDRDTRYLKIEYVSPATTNSTSEEGEKVREEIWV